jgi:FkbM family methyltransferase
MIKKIKQHVKAIFRKIGINVSSYNAHSSNNAQIVASMKEFGIDLILDVGANKGQFARSMRGAGYEDKIISFEPLTSAHSELVNSKKADNLWEVYPRTAIGDQNGEVVINIAGNSSSSSVLPMLDSHKNAAPNSAYVDSEKVHITTIDSIADDIFKEGKKPFLKIDTQGFEWQVLDGAEQTLPKIQGVLLELSLIPLYDGQRLWLDLVNRLQEAGFTLWALQSGFTDSKNGRTYQVDGIFYRK